MNDLNSILLEGTLEGIPYLVYKPNGATICTFKISSSRTVERDGGIETEAHYFDILTKDRLAEVCVESLHLGTRVRVWGLIQQDRREDITGETHSKVYIKAEHLELNPSRKD